MTRLFSLIALCLCVELSGSPPAQFGLGTARVTTPPAVLFTVVDVSASTVASSPTTVSFDSALLGLGQALRISVRADGDITMPGAAPIPSSNLSWTTGNVVNGTATNGTVSQVAYTPVFVSQVGASSGRVDLSWTIAAHTSTVRSGTRQATLRWKFEAITP